MSKRIVTLVSSDRHAFEVEESVICQSQTIKHMIEDDCSDNIPVPNVTASILTKVIEYCKKHVDNDEEKKEEAAMKKWDATFVDVDQGTLFDLMLAANYLNIKNLLDLTCQAVAERMKGKSPEYIRTMFNITNDFTPEEEEEVRRENQWAVDA